MSRKINALYFDANGSGKRVMTTDTVLRGIFGYQDGALPPRMLARSPYVCDLFAHLRQFHEALSYANDWRNAFQESPKLKLEICNINNFIHLAKCLALIPRYDLVIVSHIAAGDDMTVLLRIARALALRACPMLLFIGNEYDLLDEKIEFIRRAKPERICSQLPIASADYLYGGIEGTQVVSAPHALNPKVYFPPETEERTVDIGFVGDVYWPFVGDEERTILIRHFENNCRRYGLRCDIRAGRAHRLPRAEWAKFLQNSSATVGAESGTYYLNERGTVLGRARSYNLKENQAASFENVYQRFFAGVPREISGKSVSSRHFEPVGTKTCQILIEGDYNGILKPGEHYIAVKSDLSNVDDAVREFKDLGRRREITNNVYDYVMSHHTYAHRVQNLLASLF